MSLKSKPRRSTITNYTVKKVGILGGGQLARMLILKGHELGLQMHVLSENPHDPAAQVTRNWQKGSPHRLKDVTQFMKKVDVCSFESEFFDPELLQKASRSTKTPLRPSAHAMGLLQDRWTQKKALAETKIKTADFLRVSDWIDFVEACTKFPRGFVLKKRRFGYDGYGTFVIRDKALLQTIVKNKKGTQKIDRQIRELKSLLKEVKEGFIAEAFINFKRELSLIVARNKKGQCISFPLVETRQEDSRCAWVKGPIANKQVQNFQLKSYQFLKKLKYEGLMAFELFETSQGLYVNEIAPRVHNSGHFSLDGLSEDQFTLHLKAILNAPLVHPRAVAPGFAMLNLLGTSTKKPKWTLPGHVHLHWYGKKDNRKGRKMGHLNCVHRSPSTALSTLLRVKREFQI